MKDIQHVFDKTEEAAKTDSVPDQQRILIAIRTVGEISQFLLGVRHAHGGKGHYEETQAIDIEATQQYRRKLGENEITSNDNVWTETDYSSSFAWLIDEVDNTKGYRGQGDDWATSAI